MTDSLAERLATAAAHYTKVADRYENLHPNSTLERELRHAERFRRAEEHLREIGRLYLARAPRL